jgi:Tfp pilus assembly protein PilO
MKTLSQINQEIKDLERQEPELRYNEKQKKRVAKQLVALRQQKYYIESGVTESALQKQLAECKRLLDVIDNGFDSWINNLQIVPKNPLAAYRKEFERQKIVVQIKSLNDLLS